MKTNLLVSKKGVHEMVKAVLRGRRFYALGFAFLIALAGNGNVYLYECERFEEKGGWATAVPKEKDGKNKTALNAVKGSETAETVITTPGAGDCRSWILATVLTATNQLPAKFAYQINGEERVLEVKGDNGKSIWIDGGAVMLPAGYSSVGLRAIEKNPVSIDCVIVTDEADFRPPAEAEKIEALRKSNSKN